MLQPLGSGLWQLRAAMLCDALVRALRARAVSEAGGAEPGGDGDAAEVGPGAKESPAPGGRLSSPSLL